MSEITVGYVTVEESDEYVRTHYVSTDDLRKGWEALSSEDKAALLTKSFQAIELLPFTGRKLNPKQKTAFPRWPSEEVPERIKWAQIENALAKSNATTEEDAQYYERLWMYGIESYSIGNLSESTSKGSYGIGSAQATGINSVVAERLLRPFLGGGYRM